MSEEAQENTLMGVLEPFEKWAAASLKAVPLAPDDLIWAGYGKDTISIGQMRLLYYAIRGLRIHAARQQKDENDGR